VRPEIGVVRENHRPASTALSFLVPPRHLYVHVPFCARRCSYCDFSIAVRRDVPVRDYVEGIRRELAIRERTDDRMELDTLYLGGGTPSRWEAPVSPSF
jgi:Coproporphyrinogen III oxidase and related Fe-S oxidoreductases